MQTALVVWPEKITKNPYFIWRKLFYFLYNYFKKWNLLKFSTFLISKSLFVILLKEISLEMNFVMLISDEVLKNSVI
jgi:hypothetical protein